MAFGKSVRIYLKDGTVTGMKFGEVVNHTIQSISCPRLKAGELAQLTEAKRPGVYFLFGKDEETNEDMVYIGEAENVYDRLQNHLVNKGFWNEVIFFISKDENLTKAHVKYLESRIIQTANVTKRYKIENANQPQLPALPLADRDAMEEFLEQVKMLVGIFGHKVLEDFLHGSQLQSSKQISKPNNAETLSDNNISITELFLVVAGTKAKAVQTNEGIVVLAGSEAVTNPVDTISNGYKELRRKLVDSEYLKLDGRRFIFQKDVLFSSASAAAAIICGYATNGLLLWKNKDGISLRAIEQEKISSPTKNSIDESNLTL